MRGCNKTKQEHYKDSLLRGLMDLTCRQHLKGCVCTSKKSFSSNNSVGATFKFFGIQYV